MISFVIPVFRSERSINELFERLLRVSETNSWAIEIIFVEDCGGDKSWNIIQELAAVHKNVIGFQMSRNYGQHNALLCGVRKARGDIIVTLDDDLQHPPEELPKLVSRLSDDVDLVYGSPEKEPHSLLRNLFSPLIKLALESAMDTVSARQISALRAFKTPLRDAFAEYRGTNVNLDVLLAWGTTRSSAVRIRYEVRKYGSSGYTSKKLFTHTLNMITGFSTFPLRLASVLGFAFSLFGLLILAYVAITWILRGSVVPGFVFLASIIAVFSGVQLLALGMIGEYLSRMYLRSMERPSYNVKTSTLQR